MLHRLPKWELSSYEHQTTLDKIRERLSSTDNLQEELRRLYTVKNYSEFAMSLMWMAERVERNAEKYDSTPEEDELVFSFYRKAVGESIAPTLPPSFEFTPPSQEQTTIPPVAEPPATDSIWGDFTSFSNTAQELPAPPPAGSTEFSQVKKFSESLDQVLQAIQSGAESRLKSVDALIAECNAMLADANTPEDCRSFCQPLQEFLDFVVSGDLIDDIRVMNIVSNIQGPFAQWEQAEPENRSGILDGAIEILHDFKTMFE